MKAKSFNLSADLTEALKAQAPYSKRGRTLAQNAISMLDTTVSNVSYELQSEIDRLYYKNFRNDETTAKLSSQLTKIRSDYSILPQKMREDVDSISRNDFSITVFGRTMAGKSTLMEILTHGDGKSIGNGAQRFTRDEEHTAIRNSILQMCLESQRLRERMMRMLRLMPPRNVI